MVGHNLTRDLLLVVQRYSRANLTGSGVTFVLKVSWERNRRPTLSVASTIYLFIYMSSRGEQCWLLF